MKESLSSITIINSLLIFKDATKNSLLYLTKEKYTKLVTLRLLKKVRYIQKLQDKMQVSSSFKKKQTNLKIY